MDSMRGNDNTSSQPECSYTPQACKHGRSRRWAAPLLYAASMTLLFCHGPGALAGSARQLQEAHSKVHRRARHDHTSSSRTLADAPGGMPHSFYQRSVNVSMPGSPAYYLV
jgi:hypothetical protein